MLNVLTTHNAGTKIPVIDLRSATAAEFAGELMKASCVFVVGHEIPLQKTYVADVLINVGLEV
jgi:hypothetical protein